MDNRQEIREPPEYPDSGERKGCRVDISFILTAFVAFLSEYLDASLGMGYGTALAPVLIIMGYDPLKVVSAILFSQLCTDIAACLWHHRFSNVNFSAPSRDLRIALLMGFISSIGVILSVLTALRIPGWLISWYIGILVLSMGIAILATTGKTLRFSWHGLVGISLLASFNKGISGGGYGPLIMGGQLVSGVDAKKAVGITAFAEAITCLVGFLCYLLQGRSMDWKLIALLTVSAMLAVPIAAITVRHTFSERLKRYVGILIIVLGLAVLLKLAGA
jgi:uncharacterized protein